MANFTPTFGSTKKNIQFLSGIGPAGGTFQATAGAVTTIVDANVPASAHILFSPGNAAAGLLDRTKTLSIATGNSAGSFVFTVSATGAGAPAGTETFTYFVSVVNP